ncbi:MAG: hypothetical protein V7L29_30850 [Nostoc sp.]
MEQLNAIAGIPYIPEYFYSFRVNESHLRAKSHEDSSPFDNK